MAHNVIVTSELLVDGQNFAPIARLWLSWFPVDHWARHCGGALQSLARLHTSHCSPNKHASVTGPHLVIGPTFITAPCKPVVFVFRH